MDGEFLHCWARDSYLLVVPGNISPRCRRKMLLTFKDQWIQKVKEKQLFVGNLEFKKSFTTDLLVKGLSLASLRL